MKKYKASLTSLEKSKGNNKRRGVLVETMFDCLINHLWNVSCVHKVADYGSAGTLESKGGSVSDRIVFRKGLGPVFCEIKTSLHKTGFDILKALRPTQHFIGTQCVKVNGLYEFYYVFVYSEELREWFQIPYSYIYNNQKPSMKTWATLEKEGFKVFNPLTGV